eukprot:331059-Rhodomonas_salina.1
MVRSQRREVVERRRLRSPQRVNGQAHTRVRCPRASLLEPLVCLFHVNRRAPRPPLAGERGGREGERDGRKGERARAEGSKEGRSGARGVGFAEGQGSRV